MPALRGRSAWGSRGQRIDPGAPSAPSRIRLPGRGAIVLIVGPEGGVSPAEADLMTGAGAVTARLGPTVLRSSSAGAAAAALALARSGRVARADSGEGGARTASARARPLAAGRRRGGGRRR